MAEATITCPSCGGAVPSGSTICPDCHEDLAALAHLEFRHAIAYNEALALAREGDLDGARIKAAAALEARPDFGAAHVLLIKTYAAEERWDDARRAVVHALEAAPDDEGVASLAEELQVTLRAAEARSYDETVSAEVERRQKAEGYLRAYKRDVLGAFGVGLGFAAMLGFFLRKIGGRRA